MARKNKKLLSTLRALDDKQEPRLNQHDLEEKAAIAPLLDSGAGESELKLQESELTHSVVAPLLGSSLLEEQLSLVTEPTSIIDPVPTAESLHLTDLTEPVDATAPEATLAVTSETSEPPQDQAIAQPETEAEAEIEPEVEPEAVPQPEATTQAEELPTVAVSELSDELSDEDETNSAQLQPTETATPGVEVAQTTPQPEQAIAEPIASKPSHNSKVAEPAVDSGEPAEEQDAAIATRSKAELLRRPEAPVLIVFAFLASLWQAYVNIGAKPAPSRQRLSQNSSKL